MRNPVEPAAPPFPPSDHGAAPPARRLAQLLLLVLLSLTPLLSCRPPARDDLLRLVPTLSPEIAARLIQDDPAAFRRYARRLDPRDLGGAYMKLLTALPDTIHDFVETEQRLAPYLTTLAAGLADHPSTTFLARAFAAFQRRPLDERVRAVSLMRRVLSTVLDTRIGAEEKAAAFEGLIADCGPYADVINLGDLYGPYCELLARLHREDELIPCFTRGTAHALAFGDTALACQFLGGLGTRYGHMDDDAGMRASWDRALELARAIGSWQEARILSFYAAYQRRNGNPARAVALLDQAGDCCRRLKQPEAEIRFLYARLELFTEHACWDLVERDLRRADLLLRTGGRNWVPAERATWSGRILAIRMQLAAARQDDRPAQHAARGVLTHARALSPGPVRARLGLQAARILARFGSLDEARALVTNIATECDSLGVAELLPGLRLDQAEFDLAAGDLAGGGAALTLFREATWSDTTDTTKWIRHDGLMARRAWQAHDRPEALRRLAAALGRLERFAAAAGDAPEAGLVFGQFRGLRTLFHEICSDDPGAGYRFEMGWSALRFGRKRAGQNPAAVARAILSADLPGLPEPPPGALHCVYYWGDDRIVRWTRAGGSVTRQELPVAPGDLRARLERAVERLSHTPAGATPPDPGSARELHDLAELLLPAELLAAGDRRTLLITRDGPLARLPLEALSLSATDYRPLLLEHDVAYLNTPPRIDGPAPEPEPMNARTMAGALVVTAPEYADEITRRWSALNEPLPSSVSEAAQFAAAAPGALVLRGGQATRAAVLARWESAPQIYLATHFVHAPELSYEALIPLAGGVDTAAVVDMRDIRRADLSDCRLVVLSGCDTGARYAAGDAEIASLGDLFARAGAAAVVQTGWSVRDDEGAALMHEFNDRYAADPHDPVAVLADARRELIRRGAPPGVWAGYTILINDRAAGFARHAGTETAWNRTR